MVGASFAVMSSYLPALGVVAVAGIVLILLVVRTFVLVRRFGTLAVRYRGHLKAQLVHLQQRRATLLTEMARRLSRR